MNNKVDFEPSHINDVVTTVGVMGETFAIYRKEIRRLDRIIAEQLRLLKAKDSIIADQKERLDAAMNDIMVLNQREVERLNEQDKQKDLPLQVN